MRKNQDNIAFLSTQTMNQHLLRVAVAFGLNIEQGKPQRRVLGYMPAAANA